MCCAVGQNRISELPASFSRLTSLRICLLSKNHLELLPSDFGDLTKLEDLRLDNNKAGDSSFMLWLSQADPVEKGCPLSGRVD